jgi:hypothetical protein
MAMVEAERGATGTVAPDASVKDHVLNQPFTLSQGELISYIKESAAEQASAATRERLNFVFSLIGIVAGLVAAGGFFMAQTSLEKTAAEVTKEQVKELEVRLQADIDEKFDKLQIKNDAALRKAVEPVLLIALIGSEANSLANDPRGSRGADRKRMIDMLAERHAEITALQGPTRDLAFRRIEDLFGSFYGTGDTYAAFRLVDIFGDDLIRLDGPQITYARLLTQSILSDPDFLVTNRADVDGLLGRTFDRTNRWLLDERRILGVVKDGTKEALAVDQVADRLIAEDGDNPGFVFQFSNAMDELSDSFASAGLRRSSSGIKAVRMFREAAAIARQKLPPLVSP